MPSLSRPLPDKPFHLRTHFCPARCGYSSLHPCPSTTSSHGKMAHQLPRTAPGKRLSSCELGDRHGHPSATPPLRRTHAFQEPVLYSRCSTDTLARHRRDHRHVQRGQRRPAQPVPVCRSRPPCHHQEPNPQARPNAVFRSRARRPNLPARDQVIHRCCRIQGEHLRPHRPGRASQGARRAHNVERTLCSRYRTEARTQLHR